ncbi:unnamed protein product [Rotaria sp. Silwood2]|nr:unnamed protein product [Rotaria sp. Silwood2]CAF2945273.1 unnamed protein product [Rotaria sp. Silwood2]CAF3345740.1 unnamed protein product [Rotaria sp. Silwood2]CAF4232069.1 unnamed protein product [Rotaria sp. Silwood2]CAF4359239.1 unnamed protein product [Rotaria sp. Silwood2]
MHDCSSQLSNIDDGEFEIAAAAADDDDADNRTTADLNVDDDNNDDFCSNDDYYDKDEQGDTRNLINTTKENFAGMKILNAVQPRMEHCYFKVTVNDDIKYLHQQTAC